MGNHSELQEQMRAWRHELHAHPEFGFEEKRTAAFVGARLREFGLDDAAEGVGGTGVVGTLRRGAGNRSIGLRADMDALRIPEQGDPSYKSANPGVMHACGHDGHTAMLLGAARMLAEEGGFDGTVRFIFQPAEEWGRGALAMLEDGLMTRFPFDEIYGLHNMPGMPVGRFETRPGAIMSAEDIFEITLEGVGGHAARPHWGREAMVAACALVLNLQSIVSRRLSPSGIAVVSVTEILADGTRKRPAGRRPHPRRRAQLPPRGQRGHRGAHADDRQGHGRSPWPDRRGRLFARVRAAPERPCPDRSCACSGLGV